MFHKYPSIENTYRQKELQKWLNMYPELANLETFIVQEKLHGSNIQVVIKNNEEIQVYSRNRLLSPDENFQGVKVYDLIEEKYPEISNFMANADFIDFYGNNCDIYTFYGELFGKNIQKGVNYGSEVQILFFDMAIDGYIRPFVELEKLAQEYRFEHLLVPEVYKIQGIEKIDELPCEYNSLILGIDNNIMEGIVIKPYNKVYVDKNGNICAFKKKNKAFMEKQKAKKSKPKKEVDPELQKLNEEFVSYITDARIQNVFSKYGEIEEPSQLGEYIKYVLEDAKEDFFKDFGKKVEGLDKKDVKYVLNVGKTIANKLQEYL